MWYNDLCLCSNTHHEEPIIRLTQEKLQKFVFSQRIFFSFSFSSLPNHEPFFRLISDRQDYSGTLKDLRNMYQNYDGDYNFLTYKPSTYKVLFFFFLPFFFLFFPHPFPFLETNFFSPIQKTRRMGTFVLLQRTFTHILNVYRLNHIKVFLFLLSLFFSTTQL